MDTVPTCATPRMSTFGHTALTAIDDPTGFTCATCGSEVILRTQMMFTSAAPAGAVKDWRHICRRDPAHDVGELTVALPRT